MRISLADAATLLLTSEVVAVPTETVYGLAACLNDFTAIQKIYTLKSRPPQNPLIIHVASSQQIHEYVEELPDSFEALAAAFWPGPLTLVLPVKSNKVLNIVTAGLKTAAFRVPRHSLTRKLLAMTGPLVMPSANLSGKPSSTSAEHVEKDFTLDFPVLDGGPSEEGLESTILIWDSKKWVIGRLGALDADCFLPVIGYIPGLTKKHNDLDVNELKETPTCPGQMFRHYAPKARLIFFKQDLLTTNPCQVIVGFDDKSYSREFKIYSLGLLKNPKVAAERLYAVLRQLDQDEVKEAFVDMDFPANGLWITIRERLEKAASS